MRYLSVDAVQRSREAPGSAQHRYEIPRWVVFNLALPYLVFWLVVFIPTRNIAASFSVSSVILVLLLPLAAFSFYKDRIRRVHPHLKLSRVDTCSLCGEHVERTQFTSRLFMIPYGFKSLRHYERKHVDLAKSARRARLSLTIFVDGLIIALGAFLGFNNVIHPNTPLSPLEIIGAFSIPFVVIEAILWLSLRYMLIGKRGAVFGS